MEYGGKLVAVASAGDAELCLITGMEGEVVAGEAGRAPADLSLLDRIRDILLAAGLPPEPGNYELLYIHLSGADPSLSREVERLLAAGQLTSGAIFGLRKAHFGEIAASELLELVEAAQKSAIALADQLDRSHHDFRTYDATIEREDQALAVARSAHELAELVQRMRRANARVMQVNRRLEGDITTTRLEMSRLIDRLESAERSARTDPLTGLLNRRGVLEALRKAQAKAAAAGHPLSAAIVDIDNFKRFNDRWGHAIGDEVLRCVGTHLASQARQACDNGFAGRFGGEEFVVALPGVALREAAAAMDGARALLARQVLRRSDNGATLDRISFSAGVATRREADTPETMLDRADAALYAAKRAGRDRVLPEAGINGVKGG